MSRRSLGELAAGGLGVGGVAILLAIMTSVFGALNDNLLAKPRVAYAMARDGCYRLRLESPHGGGVTGAQSVEWISGRPLERRGSNHEPRRSLYLPQAGPFPTRLGEGLLGS
jgi:hypothetical protein